MPSPERFGLVNLRTGELYEAQITAIPKRLMRGRFMRLWVDSKRELMMRSPGLHGQAYRVLAYVETVAHWDNEIPSTGETSQVLNLRQPHVSRAYTELAAAEFIIKRGTRYYLSPLVGWKGTQKAFDTACRELFADPQPRALPAGQQNTAR